MKDIFPQKAQTQGKYLLSFDNTASPHTHVCDEGFGVLAGNYFDYGFLGPKTFTASDPQGLITEAAQKIKLNGHLIVLTRVIDTDTETLVRMVAKVGAWKQKASLTRDGLHLAVYKKIQGGKGIQTATVRPKKSACVVRYGALGDAILVTPLIRALKADGYHVTLNITPYASSIFEHNPNVDNFIWQEREAIPNPELGDYWKEWASEYDRYINLSESIEGGLLKLEGRQDFFTSSEWRRRECNINYQDRTMAIGGYTERLGERGEIFLTKAERRNALRFKESLGAKRMVLWGLNGSSHHKMYALIQPFLNEYLAANPNIHVVLLGDERAKDMEFAHPQVTPGCARWTLREVMALCEIADCVVGPESALVNFASCWDTPKVVLLSHSSAENFTRDWTNTTALAPDVPCYPCHQLHYTLESCPIGQIVENGEVLAEGPVCVMGAITMTQLTNALNKALNGAF